MDEDCGGWLICGRGGIEHLGEGAGPGGEDVEPFNACCRVGDLLGEAVAEVVECGVGALVAEGQDG